MENVYFCSVHQLLFRKKQPPNQISSTTLVKTLISADINMFCEYITNSKYEKIAPSSKSTKTAEMHYSITPDSQHNKEHNISSMLQEYW